MGNSQLTNTLEQEGFVKCSCEKRPYNIIRKYNVSKFLDETVELPDNWVFPSNGYFCVWFGSCWWHPVSSKQECIKYFDLFQPLLEGIFWGPENTVCGICFLKENPCVKDIDHKHKLSYFISDCRLSCFISDCRLALSAEIIENIPQFEWLKGKNCMDISNEYLNDTSMKAIIERLYEFRLCALYENFGDNIGVSVKDYTELYDYTIWNNKFNKRYFGSGEFVRCPESKELLELMKKIDQESELENKSESERQARQLKLQKFPYLPLEERLDKMSDIINRRPFL